MCINYNKKYIKYRKQYKKYQMPYNNRKVIFKPIIVMLKLVPFYKS